MSNGYLKPGAKCKCRAPLPWHLFEVGLNRHTCSCGRVYADTGDGISCVTVEVNPFAVAKKAGGK